MLSSITSALSTLTSALTDPPTTSTATQPTGTSSPPTQLPPTTTSGQGEATTTQTTSAPPTSVIVTSSTISGQDPPTTTENPLTATSSTSSDPLGQLIPTSLLSAIGTQSTAVTTSASRSGNDTNAGAVPDIVPTTSTPGSSSSAWLPTALVTASTVVTSSSLQTNVDPTSTAQVTGTPSTPKIITPADGIPNTPPNSTLVRIGFLESLNYQFVVNSSVTVAQIFQVLPLAGSFALGVQQTDVTVRSLEPYPVAQYTATTALIWVPADQVNKLQVEILTTNSLLYSQSNPTAKQLVDAIDPTIPLVVDGTTGNTGSTGQGTANTDGSSSLSNSGAISGSLDNGQPQDGSASSSLIGKQVAIGIGAAVAALAYAALMFLCARRFRRQSAQAQADRRTHSRVSSITGERAASPPFAQSYRSSGSSSGRGVRGQNISAPLMTENSLLL